MSYIRTFGEVGIADVPLVGGKNASLGEMYRHIHDRDIRVPNGFAVTADGYRHFLRASGIDTALATVFADLDIDDRENLAERADRARKLLLGASLPEDLTEEILAGYRALRQEYGDDVALAVRSSATAEDLPDASFAGQHETYLHVQGEEALLDAVRRCFASIFTDRAVDYRARHGYDQLSVALSVGVMKMVRSDLACSGVSFTLDTESGFRDVVFVTGSYGLGENVVQGLVEPDEFYVHKPTYAAGHRAVLSRRLGSKAVRMVLGESEPVRNEPTPPAERDRFCLTDEEVLELAGAAMTIERHYGKPMDIEWAKDGTDGLLYVVQARPETVAATRRPTVTTRYVVDAHGDLITSGRAVGAKVGAGRARIVRSMGEDVGFTSGDVLVASSTSPDWEPLMKIASAVVTEHGGRTCHAAIVARELGIPAVVGTGDATSTIIDGEEVTVSCAEGDEGHVYRGLADFHANDVATALTSRPRTHVMLNLGNPGIAFESSFLPNDGVGLARMEFILAEHVRVHPLAALHPDRITDPSQRAEVERLVGDDGAAYVVEKLAEGIGSIAAAFHPKPVVVRLSDFKTNEYATLLGGADFEPAEANPMLGFRGAARYAHPAYTEGFALECAALRRVREEIGLENVIVMLPFVRRLDEADRVLARMAELGLRRGDHGLKVYAMCEIPSNVILVDEFAERFDGFSIGSNDLTQLTLGVDRDSELVAFDYDERDLAVQRMITLAVEGCRRHGMHSGICGQAPSDHPEVVRFLVGLGIDAISVTPDSILAVTQTVLAAEG
ncbi:phosphoenolpyruvate synthase [Nocardioides luteus]|uniref:Phosphoenolpyruvate synthase n=1 Tax=Nocardioides luteus TaxID=1844 RepID=A0A1J4N7Z7_9ACTN|nr:phosphoenolpyruvate synthase [Nocardioides luteus]OIJ27643.1 phosphoenolpyruvate synthase [Nocardioides luteus]